MGLGFSNIPQGIIDNPEYISYVVQYQGDLIGEAGLAPDYYITIVNEKYAVITKKILDLLEDRLSIENCPFPSVVYVARYDIYTVEYDFKESIEDIADVNPLSVSDINTVTIIKPLNLTGKGVVVGIIDTGIDYLNNEFINADDTTRILRIWDQSDNSGQTNEGIPYGHEYTSDDINRAINEYRKGKDPYSIVNSRDEIGHGTAMAGIIGGNGRNLDTSGAVPECEFVVVKLKRSVSASNFITSVYPIYDMASIMLGIEYIYRYAVEKNVPAVIYEPEGTTFGNHRSNGLLEDYEDDILNNLGIAILNSTGNQANAKNHASGRINAVGDSKEVSLYIGEDQKFLRIEIWAYKPNIMSLNIISPSGEITGIMPALFKQKQINNFILEQTKVRVEYFIPEDLSGDELIYVDFFFLQPGVWTLQLIGNKILDGKFEMWMLPGGMLRDGTGFLSPDSYGTIMSPSTNRYSITVANANQNNLNIVETSGISFEDIRFNQVDLAAGGVNVKCTFPGNKVIYATGSSVSTAVVAGAAAILFQWGIIKKNNPYMYSQNLKSYLLKGTIKRPNDTYPNPRWGYGILNLLGVFSNL